MDSKCEISDTYDISDSVSEQRRIFAKLPLTREQRVDIVETYDGKYLYDGGKASDGLVLKKQKIFS